MTNRPVSPPVGTAPGPRVRRPGIVDAFGVRRRRSGPQGVGTTVRRAGAAVVIGLTVGALTSFGQTVLGTPLSALVNSAGAWLIAPFVVGCFAPSVRSGAMSGVLVCAAQLVGYDVTAALRGFGFAVPITVFWGACAVVGGPIFGAAGVLWRAAPPALRGLGGTTLPAAFLAEGAWVYGHELRYWSTMALWLLIGIALLAVLGRGGTQRRWIALTLPVALIGELALTTIYDRAF